MNIIELNDGVVSAVAGPMDNSIVNYSSRQLQVAMHMLHAGFHLRRGA